MVKSSNEESCADSTPDASGEDEDSRQITKKRRSGRRNVSSSVASSPRGTPDSLRSGPLRLLHNVLRKGDFDLTDSYSSDSESSCGYPLLTGLSRTPSIKSIPDAPFHPMFQLNERRPPQRTFRARKLRPASAQSLSSRPEYSSRSSTAGVDNHSNHGDEGDVLERDKSVISLARRPASAPDGAQTKRSSCLRSRRSSPKVSFAPVKDSKSHVQTQTHEALDGKVVSYKTVASAVGRTHTATQTLPTLYCDPKMKYEEFFRSEKASLQSKSIQTNVNFPRGMEENVDNYLDFTITAIAKRQHYERLRANSARGPRTEKSPDNTKIQRCKSALAIMVTRNRVGESCPRPRTICTTPPKRATQHGSDDEYFNSSETSSNISDSTRNFFDPGRSAKYRSHVAPRTCTHGHAKKSYQQGIKITPNKLAKLKKAYGTKSFDLSGLAFYTKKLRLPMHGGYKSVSSREVDDIVERLSSCRLSCGRMHDYSAQDSSSVPKRRKRRECHTAPSTRGSSRTNHDGSRPNAGRNKKNKIPRRSKHPTSDRMNQEFGTVLTKSLNQIEDSLSRARYVLSNLSGYVSASPPECRRRRTTSLRSARNEPSLG